jgi:hypothetical protein
MLKPVAQTMLCNVLEKLGESTFYFDAGSTFLQNIGKYLLDYMT